MSDTPTTLAEAPAPKTHMACGRDITKNTHSAVAFRAIWDRMVPGVQVQVSDLHNDAVRRGERISQHVLTAYLCGKVNAGEARRTRKGFYERIAPLPAPAPAILPNPDPEPELPPPGTVERELVAAKARIAQLEVEVLELRAKLEAVPLAAEDARTAIARAVADLETARRELHGLL